MKIRTTIRPGRFVCKEGRLQAQGKKASPAFCYRLQTEHGEDEKTVIEIHSNVTGKKIGYIGKSYEKPFARTRAGASIHKKLQYQTGTTQESIDKKMRHLLKTAQNLNPDDEYLMKKYRKAAQKAFREMMRAAKK
jgi:hypothetical protein